ncbi:MAG: FAD-binding oxidoreductase [Cellvibrio sp.]|uniref:FAD-binding oxidoreductase n=1 Tax=Cellvibrio sp. TaxID=1965322 RepID=UPI0027174D99|nr:FAD-binding oxidoreductase [Cellvibrio sp.]
MPLVSLANNKQFQCATDTNLLDAAKAAGLVLEHSCRTGRCSACKTLQLSGESRVLQAEESLSDEERKAGYILTCCRSAITEIELDTEDMGLLADIKVQTMPCKIDSINSLAPDVMQIVLRLPPKNAFNYLPGQYINVIAPNGTRRSYSIANAKNESGKIELHIRQVTAGVMSNFWFNSAKTNDLLRFEGPHGSFCFHEKPGKNIIFLATGTGIAPIKSMLEALSADPISLQQKNLFLYWGGRTFSDIYWQPEFPALPLEFRPTLSRTDNQWGGRHGYVQNAVVTDELDLGNSIVYACGSNQMIQSAKKLLINKGLNPKHFFADAFVSS